MTAERKQTEKELQRMFTRPIGGYNQGQFRFGATVPVHIHLNKQKVAAYDLHPATNIVQVVRLLSNHYINFTTDAVVDLRTEFVAEKIILYVTTENWTPNLPVLDQKVSYYTKKDPPYVETSIRIEDLGGINHIYKYGSLWLTDSTVGSVARMRLVADKIDPDKLLCIKADAFETAEGMEIHIDMRALEEMEFPEMPYYGDLNLPGEDVKFKVVMKADIKENNAEVLKAPKSFKNMDRELIKLAEVKETHIFTIVVFEQMDSVILDNIDIEMGPNAIVREQLGVKFLAKAKAYIYETENEAIIKMIGSDQIQIICSRATKKRDACDAVNAVLIEMLEAAGLDEDDYLEELEE